MDTEEREHFTKVVDEALRFARLMEARDEGMAFLDEVYPEWIEHIDTELLDMWDTTRCIWGQLVGDGSRWTQPGFWKVRSALKQRDNYWSEQQVDRWMRRHGFDAPHDTAWELTDLWVEAIQDRRNA